MATYSVQFGPMLDAHQGLQDVHTRLTNMVEDLNNQVTSNTHEFEGGTRDEFFRVHKEYNDHHAALTDALHQCNNALGNIHESYTGVENRGTQRWGM